MYQDVAPADVVGYNAHYVFIPLGAALTANAAARAAVLLSHPDPADAPEAAPPEAGAAVPVAQLGNHLCAAAGWQQEAEAAAQPEAEQCQQCAGQLDGKHLPWQMGGRGWAPPRGDQYTAAAVISIRGKAPPPLALTVTASTASRSFSTHEMGPTARVPYCGHQMVQGVAAAVSCKRPRQLAALPTAALSMAVSLRSIYEAVLIAPK